MMMPPCNDDHRLEEHEDGMKTIVGKFLMRLLVFVMVVRLLSFLSLVEVLAFLTLKPQVWKQLRLFLGSPLRLLEVERATRTRLWHPEARDGR
jgi:hypothetical protein